MYKGNFTNGYLLVGTYTQNIPFEGSYKTIFRLSGLIITENALLF
jgi:hypothetical protein